MKMKKIISALFAISFALVTLTAEAIPNFATKTGKNCSYCHNAWPQLNKKGRDYKEAGYLLSGDMDEKTSDFLESGEFPVSAILVARPYDKKDSGDRKLRALHEAEVIVAGVIGDGWSGLFELEAEDEDLNARGLEVGVPLAQMTYHHNPLLNIQFSWSDAFYADPYGLLADHFRLTRGRVALMDQAFGGADGRLRSNRQNVSLYGRPVNSLFYIIGVSGEADDAEGVKSNNVQARVAFDVNDDMMLGAFLFDGENNTTGRTSSRTGIDFQADLGSSRVQAAVVSASDDNAGPGETDNDAWTIQATHVFKTKTGKPNFVPLIRLDNYEKNDGVDEYKEMTLNVAYYFTQNVKGYVEFWDRYDVPTGQTEDDRTTLQLYVAF